MESLENKETAEEAAEFKEPKPFMEFKKPILIGKVGKLPRKIVKTESNNDSDNSSTSHDDTAKETPPTINSEDELNQDTLADTSNLPLTTQLTEKNISLPYKEPKWSGLPPADSGYSFEVLKSGIILETIDLTKKPFCVFGRLSVNNVVSAHPTISRYEDIKQHNAGIKETDNSCEL